MLALVTSRSSQESEPSYKACRGESSRNAHDKNSNTSTITLPCGIVLSTECLCFECHHVQSKETKLFLRSNFYHIISINDTEKWESQRYFRKYYSCVSVNHPRDKKVQRNSKIDYFSFVSVNHPTDKTVQRNSQIDNFSSVPGNHRKEKELQRNCHSNFCPQKFLVSKVSHQPRLSSYSSNSTRCKNKPCLLNPYTLSPSQYLQIHTQTTASPVRSNPLFLFSPRPISIQSSKIPISCTSPNSTTQRFTGSQSSFTWLSSFSGYTSPPHTEPNIDPRYHENLKESRCSRKYIECRCQNPTLSCSQYSSCHYTSAQISSTQNIILPTKSRIPNPSSTCLHPSLSPWQLKDQEKLSGKEVRDDEGTQSLPAEENVRERRLSSKRNAIRSSVFSSQTSSSWGWTVKLSTRWSLKETVSRILFLILAYTISTSTAYKLKPTTTASHVTLAGRSAQLLCELPLPGDRPTLILWYKNDATKPFYSFDARDTTKGQHKVHDNNSLGHRSRFTLQSHNKNFQSSIGFLEVKEITLADAGNYTCRVDYVKSQTMMSLLQLTVHEEIRGLEIFDAYDKMIISETGPYKLSSQGVLSCRAYGGYPTPVVRWVTGDNDDGRTWTQETLPSVIPPGAKHPVSVVSATLHITALARKDNGRQLKCVASNTNLTHHHSKVVTIDMYLPPLEVTIESSNGVVMSGMETTLLCRTLGSTPSALLTWDLDGAKGFTKLSSQSLLDQNTTIRRLRLVVSADDDGRVISCMASNPAVEEYTKIASHTLQVHYAPIVESRLAPALDPHNIKEGDDVYFECQIRANPKELGVVWLHQGRELQSNKDDGVLAQGRNLVLQRVARHSRGKYQCRVTNSIATVTSTPTTLNVLFAPECKQSHNTTVSVSDEEEVTLDCVVESNPEEVTFTWRVNSSRGIKDMPQDSYHSQGGKSSLIYQPHMYSTGHNNYGVVLCMAENSMGIQQTPCTFIITPAGAPDEPVSCSLVKQSATSLAVACIPGHDGGLKQYFMTTVKDAATHEIVGKVNSSSATFSVDGLAPGRDYLLLVSAANYKGTSSPFIIHGYALKVAENKINNSDVSESSPLVVVFMGVVSGFILLVTVLAVATRSRCRRRRVPPDVATQHNKQIGESQDENEELQSPSTKASLKEADGDEEDVTQDTLDGPLQPLDITAQIGGGSPTDQTSRTYMPRSTMQPLHSVDPQETSSNHKYYKIKINCTRLNNESFV